MKSDLLGAAIAIFAAIGSNFGVNIQKYSHNAEEKRAKVRPYHLRPLWWVGMFFVIFGSLGDFFALGFASQSLVASLGGGSTIVVNVIFARFWLKQSLYITDVVGATMVTVGVAALAMASPKDEEYTMEEIYKLMQAAPFIFYCFMTTAFVMTLYMRVRRSKAPALRVGKVSAETEPNAVTLEEIEQEAKTPVKKTKRETSSAEETDSVSDEDPVSQDSSDSEEDGAKKAKKTKKYLQKQRSNGALQSPFPSPIYDTMSLSPRHALPGEEDDNVEEDASVSKLVNAKALARKKLYDEGEVEKHTLIIDPKLPLYWAAISGTIGAQSMLLAKCVMEMIFCSLHGDNQFKYFGTYVLIGAMVLTLLTQTHSLNLATMNGDTMSTFPVFQAFWIGMSNISGIVFFQQAHSFNHTQWVLFPTALVIALTGIYLISKHEKFGNTVKYSVALPISLSSPRQHDIVAQSFVFRVLTPQRVQEESDLEDLESASLRVTRSVLEA